MTRTLTRVRLLSAAAVATALMGGAAPRLQAEQGQGKPCSNVTLKGSYGFYRAGVTGKGPLAAIGLITFDGKGHSTATQSISRNGEIEFDITFSGTYLIGPDCTGKGFTEEGDEFVRLIALDGGKGILMLSESPGNSVYGVGTRTRED